MHASTFATAFVLKCGYRFIIQPLSPPLPPTCGIMEKVEVSSNFFFSLLAFQTPLFAMLLPFATESLMRCIR